MKSYQSVACLNLMCEVLPHVSHLSRLFQAEYLQLSMINPHLNTCIATLSSYKNATTAPNVLATKKALAEELS